ncbi:MAG: TRAM domain-containing protein [Candidatus Micrarchaeaceae archaeon]
MGIEELIEGGTYDVRLSARNPRGEGIGRIDNVVVFVKDCKARIGKTHKIRITKLHRTFAYAELVDQLNNSKYFINSGSIII